MTTLAALRIWFARCAAVLLAAGALVGVTSVTATRASAATPVYGQPVSLLSGGFGAVWAAGADAAGNMYTLRDHGEVLEWPAAGGDPIVLPFTDGSDSTNWMDVTAAGDVYIVDYAKAEVVEVPAGAQNQLVLPFSGLFRPIDLTVDDRGNVFVVDSGNRRVVELIAATGTQVTLPFPDLHYPYGVAVDGNGDIYVDDAVEGNARVLELPAGSNTSDRIPVDGLRSPRDLAVDSAGNLYICDAGLHVYEVVAGSNTLVTLPWHGLSLNYSLSIDANDNVWLADYGSAQVLEVAQGASSPVVAPVRGKYSGTALVATGDEVLAASAGSDKVYAINRQGDRALTQLEGTVAPSAIAVNSAGTIVVADMYGNRVLELPEGANAPSVLPFEGLSNPEGVAVDQTGNVYVADTGNDRVLTLAAGATDQQELPFAGLDHPHALAIQTSNLYVADTGNNRVLELSSDTGTSTTVPISGLSAPEGVAVGPDGAVLVADTGDHRVMRMATDGSTSTLPFGSLSTPTSVNVDARTGTVLVLDSGVPPGEQELGWYVIALPAIALQLDTSANPSEYRQQVQVTTYVLTSPLVPVPTGRVVFTINGTQHAVKLAAGVATYSRTFPVGTSTITADYSGLTRYPSASASFDQQVDPAMTTTAVTATPDPSVSGQSVTLTATVGSGAGTPAGTVIFAFNGNDHRAKLAGGVATLTTTRLAVGNATITATYKGSPNYAPSFGAVTHTVTTG